jgi:hypothetical protein
LRFYRSVARVGFESKQNTRIDETSRDCAEIREANTDERGLNAVEPVLSGPTNGPAIDVDSALAIAIERASRSGQWEIVAKLADELARRAR